MLKKVYFVTSIVGTLLTVTVTVIGEVCRIKNSDRQAKIIGKAMGEAICRNCAETEIIECKVD